MENKRNVLGIISVIIGGLLLLSKVVEWNNFFGDDNLEQENPEREQTRESPTEDDETIKSYSHYLNEVLIAHRVGKNSEEMKILNEKFTEITEALQKHYRSGIYAPYKTGSIAKGTSINSYYDLDMLVPFKYETFNGDYKQMFEDLYQTLKKLGFKPKKQNVSIGIPIEGKEDSYIDVVPGHEINRNNYETSNGDLILHADRDAEHMGKTVKTNIKRQFDYVKKSHPSAINIIRLLKIWRRSNDVYFKSFIIELFTIQALKTPPTEKGLFASLAHVMKYMEENMETIKIYDPGNKKNDVMKAISPERRKELAQEIGNMLLKLKQEELQGKTLALKQYFPMK